MKIYICNSILLFLHLFILNAQVHYSTEKKPAIKAYTEGIQYFNERQYDRAVSCFEKAVATDKNFIEAYLLMAQSYENLEQYEQAIKSYHEGLTINPG
ncbi:MAG TPA: tetratricopeptide repeat protein, partial [Bacteroidales bacterium]|nr:tetratricopeptide repeat protein [Bacteroidales bacterium]